MEQIEFRLSENTTGEISSSNPIVRLMQSQLGAMVLLFVSLLYPFNSFSATCTLKAAPICIDSTPCRDTLDPNGNTVKVCLSTATAPAGAMISTSSCWQYKAVYDCINSAAPTYKDTCKQVQTSGNCTNYQELNVTCNPFEPKLTGGACALFDVTYQCQTSAGRTYNETVCSNTSACTDANGRPAFCTGPVTQETDTAFASMTAQLEASRQAGVYMQNGGNPGETDPTKLSIFNGTEARCTEGLWGMADSCCVPNSKGASLTNTLIVHELVSQGSNQLAKAAGNSGSEYMFDSLFDQAAGYFEKGMEAITNTINGTQNAATTPVAPPGNSTGVPAFTPTMFNTTTAVGGAVGGALAGAGATQYAANKGANTGWSGTIGAVGSAMGTIGGTYATSYAMYAGVAAWNGAGTAAFAAGSAGASGTVMALNPYFLVAMMVLSVIMAWAACTPEDIKTQLKLGARGLCHYVGTYCETKDILGGCITTKQMHCCFNSKLARIIQEGAKGNGSTPGQISNWGTPSAPNCGGIRVSELAGLDFAQIDLSEFAAEIVVKTNVDGVAQAESVRAKTQGFMDVNGVDPSATDGILVTGSTTPLPPPTLPPTDNSLVNVVVPAMNTCTVAFSTTAITADGTTTGKFDVSSCNPGAVIVWNNKGNCAASPQTSMNMADANFKSSTVDASGNASFTVTLPPSCFAVTSPVTENVWKGLVTLSPYGTIGAIDAVWK